MGALRKEGAPGFIYMFSEHRILTPNSLILTIFLGGIYML